VATSSGKESAVVERVSSAVRLDLRPGEWVLWKARPFRFVSLQGSTASIRDSVNAELHEVAVADLRGMPSLPPEDLDQRVDPLRTTSDQSWCLTQQRESVIRELLNREGSMAERLAAAATVLDVSPRTVRRLVKQYRVSSQTPVWLQSRPGRIKSGGA
jgi:hypothetical protein